VLQTNLWYQQWIEGEIGYINWNTFVVTLFRTGIFSSILFDIFNPLLFLSQFQLTIFDLLFVHASPLF